MKWYNLSEGIYFKYICTKHLINKEESLYTVGSSWICSMD